MKTITKKKMLAFLCAVSMITAPFGNLYQDQMTAEAVQASSYVYEGQAAKINISSKSDDTLTSPDFSIGGSVDKNGSVSMTVNGKEVTKENISAFGGFNFSSQLLPGRNDVNILFTDTSGNTTRKTFNFVYLQKYNIVVDKQGSGTDQSGHKIYNSISSAVNSAQPGDVIFVKNGSYNERVTVKTANISIIGEDSQKTKVYYSMPSKNASGMYERNCMKIDKTAEGFSLENITVENSFAYTNGSDEQADALCVLADRSVFTNVRLISFQDTLLTDSSSGVVSRQYFSKCYITGNVDFIYGRGRSYFEDCDIVGRYTQYKKDGCFSAPRTDSSNKYGYVFDNCRFISENGIGNGTYRLARPWGADAAIAYINCYMGACVLSTGYGDMSGNSYKNARFAEYKSFGPGAAVNQDRKQISNAGEYNKDNVFSAGMTSSFDYSSVNSKYIDESQKNVSEEQQTQAPQWPWGWGWGQPSEGQQSSSEPSQNNVTDAVYCSPDASSGASGTINDPVSFEKALSMVKPGGVIWLKGGKYSFDKTIVINSSNNGAEGKYKTVASVPGEEAVFDFSKLSVSDSNRGIVLDGDWWHFYGIKIQYAGDNGMLLSGNNNCIEMCVFCNNQDSGLQVSRYDSNSSKAEWPSYNLIKNCTAMNNCDDKTMENADGFAAKLTCGEGNVFDGCLSYNNSDDGWDLYAKEATGPIGVVTIRNCIAFRNGYTEDGRGYGDCDGNGFKLGGGGIGTAHVVENCIAFENLHCGFTDNNNPLLGSLTSCTAYKNAIGEKANFMVYRCTQTNTQFKNLLSYAGNNSKCGSDKLFGTISNSLIMTGNKHYRITSQTKIENGAAGTQAYGPSDSDFVSMSVPSMGSDFHRLWRNQDGTINTKGFLEVKSDSSLSGLGAYVSDFSKQKASPALPSYQVTVSEPEVTTTQTEAVTTEASSSESTQNVIQAVPGDINGDRSADLTDLTLLSVYLMTKKGIPDDRLSLADVDYDGDVTIADLARFKQYVSKDSKVTSLDRK